MAQSLSALELRLQNSRDEGRGCDVKFILHQDSNRKEILAHKFVLALGSEVFKAQFFGGLTKQESEIENGHWNFKDFQIFINSFYGLVNLAECSLGSLCELYYISDYYAVNKLMTATLILIKEARSCAQEISEAAVIAHTIKNLHPALSQALVRKVVFHCGTDPENIKKFFNQHRPQCSISEFSEILQDVIDVADEKARRCKNCRKKFFLCRTQPFVSEFNFVPGALVRPTEVGNDPAALVHRLGQLRPGLTFTSSDVLGFDLPVLPLTYKGYKFRCEN